MNKKNEKRKQSPLRVRTGLKVGQFDCKSDADCWAGDVCRSGVCRTKCHTRADCEPGQICVDNDYCITIF